MQPEQRIPKNRLLALGAAVALTGIGLWFAYQPILLAIGDFLVVQDDLRPADLIHVVSGPDYRTDYGIQLYREGYGSTLFFTGGWCPLIQGNHAQRGETIAVSDGVPAQAIAIDGAEVHSTYEEIVRLKEYIEASPAPVRSILVVSDPYHMRRSRWAYRHVLGDTIQVRMAPIPFDLTPYERQWWKHEESAQYVEDEYVKMVYYVARYQLSRGRLQDWLATYDRD